MAWLLYSSLALLSMPVAIGFVHGFVESFRRPRPRLRLVIFDDDY